MSPRYTRLCRCTSVPFSRIWMTTNLPRTLRGDRNKTQTVPLGSWHSSGRGTLGAVTSVVISNTMPWEPEEKKIDSASGGWRKIKKEVILCIGNMTHIICLRVQWNQCFSILNNVWIPFDEKKFSPTRLGWPKPIYKLNSKLYTYTIFI